MHLALKSGSYVFFKAIHTIKNYFAAPIKLKETPSLTDRVSKWVNWKTVGAVALIAAGAAAYYAATSYSSDISNLENLVPIGNSSLPPPLLKEVSQKSMALIALPFRDKVVIPEGKVFIPEWIRSALAEDHPSVSFFPSVSTLEILPQVYQNCSALLQQSVAIPDWMGSSATSGYNWAEVGRTSIYGLTFLAAICSAGFGALAIQLYHKKRDQGSGKVERGNLQSLTFPMAPLSPFVPSQPTASPQASALGLNPSQVSAIVVFPSPSQSPSLTSLLASSRAEFVEKSILSLSKKARSQWTLSKSGAQAPMINDKVLTEDESIDAVMQAIIEQYNKLPSYLRNTELKAPSQTETDPQAGSKNKAEVFSSWFKENKVPLSQMLSIDLSYLNIRALPKELWQFTSLAVLDLSHNQLASVPPEINQLKELKFLNIGYNQLGSLPEEITELQELDNLFLDQNQLKTFPQGIERLTKLKFLIARNNKLSVLPDQIGNLVHLIDLQLEKNLIQSIPESIGALVYLEELYLAENQLASVPKEIGKLQQLKHLWLDSNQLESLPEELAELIKLENLSLINNPLKSLPTKLNKLTNLTGLYLTPSLIPAGLSLELDEFLSKFKRE